MLQEVLKPIFDKLGFPVFHFVYWEEDKEYVSKESFEKDDDLMYKVVIRMNGNVGTVLYGGVVGIELDNETILGTVQVDDTGKWTLVNIN